MAQPKKQGAVHLEVLLEKSAKNFEKFKQEMESITRDMADIQEEIKEAQRKFHIQIKTVIINMIGISQKTVEEEEKTKKVGIEKFSGMDQEAGHSEEPNFYGINVESDVTKPALNRKDRETSSKDYGMAAVNITRPTIHLTGAPPMGNVRSRPALVFLYLESDWDSVFEFSPTTPT